MSDPDAVIRKLHDLLDQESGLAGILFQEGTDPRVNTRDGFRLVGTPVARCSRR